LEASFFGLYRPHLLRAALFLKTTKDSIWFQKNYYFVKRKVRHSRQGRKWTKNY
jgi:hypothetical protein